MRGLPTVRLHLLRLKQCGAGLGAVSTQIFSMLYEASCGACCCVIRRE